MPGDQRVRVLDRHDDFGDPSGDQCVTAGRRAAVVGAGLERHPSEGSAHIMARGQRAPQGIDLRMRAAGTLRMAFTDDDPIAGDDDTANARVGVGQADGQRCKLEGAAPGCGKSWRTAHLMVLCRSSGNGSNPTCCWWSGSLAAGSS